MVLAEQDAVFGDAQVCGDLGSDPQLVHHPGDHGLAKHFVGLRIGLQHGHQDAVELAEGLLEEGDIVHVAALDAAGFQTELDGVLGIVDSRA